MINWLNLLDNALWIAALALALAVLSHVSWRASQRHTRLRAELARPGPQRALTLSGVLFSLGLALTAEPVWQKVVWFAITAYFIVQIVLLMGTHRNS